MIACLLVCCFIVVRSGDLRCWFFDYSFVFFGCFDYFCCFFSLHLLLPRSHLIRCFSLNCSFIVCSDGQIVSDQPLAPALACHSDIVDMAVTASGTIMCFLTSYVRFEMSFAVCRVFS